MTTTAPVVEPLRAPSGATAWRAAVHGPGDRRTLLVVGTSILLFALLWAHQMDKPLQLDDVDHYGIALAIADTGRPVYYRGEDQPALSGALHPPLHDFLLAGWFELFAPGVPQARTFALCAVLLHGLAALLLFGLLLPESTMARTRPWFWPAFLLTPYTLQMASMVDIDSSIYGPAIALLLWSVLRLSWRSGGVARRDAPAEWEYWLVALFVALCLWVKLTTIWLALVFLPLLMLLRFRPVAALARSGAAIVVGVVLFLVSFALACEAWDLDPLVTLRFVRATAGAGPGLDGAFENAAAMVLHLLRWTGLLPWLASAIVLLLAAGISWRRRGGAPHPAPEIALLLLLALATTAYYCATRHTFGNAPYKYVFTYFGILTVPLALLAGLRSAPGVAGGSTAWRRRPAAALLPPALLLGGIVVGAGAVRDEVIRSGWTAATAALWLPALLGAGAALAGLGGGPGRAAARTILRLAFLLHVGTQLGVALHQSRVEASTTYDYGQRGLAATASFVRSRTSPDERISAMKDVARLAGRRYYESYAPLYGPRSAAEDLIRRWESGAVRYIVFTEGIGQDQVIVQPLLRDWLSRNARLVASFGHYRVYEPRRRPPPAPASPPGG